MSQITMRLFQLRDDKDDYAFSYLVDDGKKLCEIKIESFITDVLRKEIIDRALICVQSL